LRHSARSKGEKQEPLAAKKAQGVKLGGVNAGLVKVSDEAKACAEALRPTLAELAGKSARAIAAEFNARKVATPNGGSWSAKTFIQFLDVTDAVDDLFELLIVQHLAAYPEIRSKNVCGIKDYCFIHHGVRRQARQSEGSGTV
jgi:hypothetical protein